MNSEEETRSGRTIIVSNRLPVQARACGDGVELAPSSGGLIRGLESIHGAGRTLWVGSLGMPSGTHLSEEDADWMESHGFHLVDVPPDLYEDYYEGFSNNAIWPLFHYVPERCHFSTSMWEAYKRVNAAFADTIAEHVGPDDTVWVHDYQLMLVPELLRRRERALSIGFFLHTPFPSAELFRILPWRREVLAGMLGADLIGFHTLEYMRNFANAATRIMGVEPQLDIVHYGRRVVRLGAFPLGIDVRGLHSEARTPEAERYLGELRALYAGRKMLLGVDRLDYTKGIPQRLMAFRCFLETHPEWAEKVSLVQVSVPSRLNVAEYQDLKREVDEMVGRVNGQFGTPGYIPIHYIFRNLEKERLLALYRCADVALITPIRDGLNLVCKEYVAAKGDEPGVLVLSEFAGAAAEMGDAILVNPWSLDGMVSAIETALSMDDADASRTMASLWQRLARYDSAAWSRSFLSVLDETTALNDRGTLISMTAPDIAELGARVELARRVFFFLDYDGTLVPIAEKPDLAIPTRRVLSLLRRMAAVPRFNATVVSGRDRRFLERYLPAEVTLVAEHGACIRRARERECVHLVDTASYDELRGTVHSIMADYERRIPGSFIEEKEFGIVWHYRMAEAIFGYQQALVLADTLGGLLQHTPLGVLMSKKAVEVRIQNASKGEAVRTVLEEEGFDAEHDLLITIGDDRTDEDMFRMHSGENISISVGDLPLPARFSIDQESLIAFLDELTRRAEATGATAHAP